MPALIDELNAKPVRQEINYFTSNPLFLELVDRRCSKGLAIEQLIRHLGILREEGKQEPGEYHRNGTRRRGPARIEWRLFD